MGERREFRLPDVGEGLTEAEILTWHVAPGDTVVVNQPIVEIETAKAAVELPCPFAGTVAALHVAAGDVVPVGTPIITLELAEAVTDQAAPAPQDEVGEPAPAATAGEPQKQAVLVGYGVVDTGAPKRRPRVPLATPSGAPRPEAGPLGEPARPTRLGGLEVARHTEEVLAHEGPVRAKPPVRRLARELGVDLRAVDPTGGGEVVTRADVERAARLHAAATSAPSGPGAVGPASAAVPRREGDERIALRGVARTMAESMVRSAFTAPHVTEWVDVDVTRSMDLVESLRRRSELEGVRVSILTLVAAGLLRAVRAHPRINASFDAEAGELVVHHDVALGIAVASPRGLVVPTIKHADRLGVPDLARALHDLATTARDGRTAPADMLGGTITITNVGVFGVDGGTPILVPGQAAILAVGRVLPRPWVVDGAVVPRQVMELSLSFDHRIVDGALGSQVLAGVAEFLTDPAVALALS